MIYSIAPESIPFIFYFYHKSSLVGDCNISFYFSFYLSNNCPVRVRVDCQWTVEVDGNMKQPRTGDTLTKGKAA
jgi:hypothetical protein